VGSSFPSEGSTDLVTTQATNRRTVLIIRRVVAVLWTLAIMTMCWLPGELLRTAEGELFFFKVAWPRAR
jgi:hypothetical protein